MHGGWGERPLYRITLFFLIFAFLFYFLLHCICKEPGKGRKIKGYMQEQKVARKPEKKP